MQSRKEYQDKDEPKVIAISATKKAVNEQTLWAAGLATVVYMWLTLLVH